MAVGFLYGIRRDESGGAIGVALVAFGVLFGAMITDGRIRFYDLSGYPWAAAASRYTTFDLLVPVGIYLALLGRPTLHVSTGALTAARVTVAAVICLQVVVGTNAGLAGGRTEYTSRIHDVRVLGHIEASTPSGTVLELGSINIDANPFGATGSLREAAHIAAEHHLSLFDNGP